jgi:potassium channel subfamily K
MNFGNRIKYIIALPMTIILWLLASGFLIADLAAMNILHKPAIPDQIWSGGFWYALSAAVLYILLMVVLTVNLIGYIRGH